MQQKFLKKFFEIRNLIIVFLVFLVIFAGIFVIMKAEAVALLPIFALFPVASITLVIINYDTIFQTILIDENGISIMFLGKTLCIYDWESVVKIEECDSYLVNRRAPIVYKVEKNDGCVIFLDKREKIKTAIETYSKRRISPNKPHLTILK